MALTNPSNLTATTQPITFIAHSPSLNDPTVWISGIAILISIVALIVSFVIFNMESNAKFREAHFNLITKASPNFLKAIDLFIKLENFFQVENFVALWNSGNPTLTDELKKILSSITETSVALFPAADELMEIVTFNFKRVKIVCFEKNEVRFPDVKGMRTVGSEFKQMIGDLSVSHFVYSKLLSIEQNQSAHRMLFDGDKKGFEREIRNKPQRKKDFFKEYLEVFEDIKTFNELYDSNNQALRSDLNKNFIRLVSTVQGKMKEAGPTNG